jgi:hypothetical protein
MSGERQMEREGGGQEKLETRRQKVEIGEEGLK